MHRLKRPYTFAINSLTLLPGTTIYKMGEKSGFTQNQKKITLASYVHFKPTLLNLTLAFYNITRVPDFWFNYVMKKKFGDRTVTMKEYPKIGALVMGLGLVKKLIHSCLRRDISPVPRPLDRWVGKLFIRRRFNSGLPPGSDEHPFKFARPTPATPRRLAAS